MSRLSAFVRTALVLAAAWGVRPPAEAASLSGTVRDYGAPNEAQAGLGGVEIVVLGPDGQEIRKSSTNAAGIYKLDNLPPGVPLKVRYSLVSYLQRPTELDAKLTEPGAVQDVDLVQEREGKVYYKQVVDNLLSRSAAASTSLEEEWQRLKEFELPPESYKAVFDQLEQRIGTQQVHQLEPMADDIELRYDGKPEVANNVDLEQLDERRGKIGSDKTGKKRPGDIKTADQPQVYDPVASPPPGR